VEVFKNAPAAAGLPIASFLNHDGRILRQPLADANRCVRSGTDLIAEPIVGEGVRYEIEKFVVAASQRESGGIDDCATGEGYRRRRRFTGQVAT